MRPRLGLSDGPRLRLSGCERKTRREPIRGGSRAPSMARDGLPLASGQPHPLMQFRLNDRRHRQVAVGSISRIRRDHDLVTPRFPIHQRQRSMLLSASSGTRTPTASRQRNQRQRERSARSSTRGRPGSEEFRETVARHGRRAQAYRDVLAACLPELFGTRSGSAARRSEANAQRSATAIAAAQKGESEPARAPSRSPRRPAPAAATPESPGPTTA